MATKILVLDKFRSGKSAKKNQGDSLGDLLKRASKLKKEVDSKKQGGGDLLLINPEDLKKMFEVKLNDFLLDNKLISAQYFICAMFIAALLEKTSFSIPESWYAVDYFIKNHETGDPQLLLDGANNCFLLSTLFSERCERRGMKLSDYICMGGWFV